MHVDVNYAEKGRFVDNPMFSLLLAGLSSYSNSGMDPRPIHDRNIFRVTDPLWGKNSGQRWIPFIKASDAELWCFPWSAPEQMVEQTIETPVILGAIALTITSL